MRSASDGGAGPAHDAGRANTDAAGASTLSDFTSVSVAPGVCCSLTTKPYFTSTHALIVCGPAETSYTFVAKPLTVSAPTAFAFCFASCAAMSDDPANG